MRDLLQNVVVCFGPHERFGVLVIEPNELVARRDQLRHAREDAAPNARARDLTDPPLEEIQPRGTRRYKVQMKSWMFHQPLLDIGVVEPIPPQQHGGARGFQAMGNRVIWRAPRPPAGRSTTAAQSAGGLVFARIHASNVCFCAPVIGNKSVGFHIPQTISDLTNIGKIFLSHYTKNLESGVV